MAATPDLGYADPGDPDGLYLLNVVPDLTVHRGDCRYLKLPHARPRRWEWADGQHFADVRERAEVDGMRLCKRCTPAAGDGRVRTAGAWYTPFNSGHANPVTHIEREGQAPLEFDPPNILFVAGGQRMRVESFETDAPVLAVERFDRVVERHRMRPRLTVAR